MTNEVYHNLYEEKEVKDLFIYLYIIYLCIIYLCIIYLAFFCHRSLSTHSCFSWSRDHINYKGWVDCTPKSKKITNETKKYICTNRFPVVKPQKSVLKNAKYIKIPIWIDPGLNNTNMGESRLHTDRVFNYLAKPNDLLIEEAKTFRELTLRRSYIAIHIRSGHIRRFPSTVQRCFKLALEFIKALKSTRNVKSVFISSDMSEYGSPVNRKHFQDEFAAMAGAVTYDPRVTGKLKIVEMYMVSLTEMLVLLQGDHLIT